MDQRRINIVGDKGKNTLKKYFWSDTKGKIILLLTAIILILASLQLVADVPVTTVVQEPIYVVFGFNQGLYVQGDNNPRYPSINQVVFPISILSCQGNTHPKLIFASVNEEVIVVLEDGTNRTWSPGIGGDLYEIKSYTKYWVGVTEDCTLSLTCPDD